MGQGVLLLLRGLDNGPIQLYGVKGVPVSDIRF